MEKPFAVETEGIKIGISGNRISKKHTYHFDSEEEAETFVEDWKAIALPYYKEAHTRVVPTVQA
jgi:hypothetical protein